MKRILKVAAACVAIASMPLLAGCNPSGNNFRTIFYNGHTYVLYDGGDFDSGMVHDPDCKCGHGK